MKLLCFGDSNTYGYDPRSYFGGRYGAESCWTDLLAHQSGWEVVNEGENGREIPRRERELERFAALLQRCQPDLLLILLGSNDLLQGASVQEAAARMEAFLHRIALAPERIVLIAPPAMQLGAWVTEPRLLADSAALAAEYRVLAEKRGAGFLDAGAWEIGLTFDGVHFTEAGHQTFAEKLHPALKALVEQLCISA